MDRFMQIAIEEAKAARDAGDFPYGAVLVKGDELIAADRNRMNTQNDPTSHAEMNVLRVAGMQATYAEMVMYASAFPCLMCAGPLVFYGVPEIIVGASWPGHEVSKAFMESHGVRITVLELEECRELIEEES